MSQIKLDWIEYLSTKMTILLQNSDEILQGGVIVISIDWTCDLDWSIDYCLPSYTFSRLDDKNDRIAKGSNFRSLPLGLLRTPSIYRVAQKNGATLSHCKYSENSMTELHGNW